jgi:hypothetical protein
MLGDGEPLPPEAIAQPVISTTATTAIAAAIDATLCCFLAAIIAPPSET